MIILGIDPGIAIVGYGLIETVGSKAKYITHGCITTPSTMSMPDRLCVVYDGIIDLIEQMQPDEIGVEELFFAKNVKTAITVAHARGAIVLACQKCNIPMFEYTPKQVKQSISGYGHADKKQVQFMVKTILNLKEIPKPDDAADALAIAIGHSYVSRNKAQFSIK